MSAGCRVARRSWVSVIDLVQVGVAALTQHRGAGVARVHRHDAVAVLLQVLGGEVAGPVPFGRQTDHRDGAALPQDAAQAGEVLGRARVHGPHLRADRGGRGVAGGARAGRAGVAWRRQASGLGAGFGRPDPGPAVGKAGSAGAACRRWRLFPCVSSRRPGRTGPAWVIGRGRRSGRRASVWRVRGRNQDERAARPFPPTALR